MFPFLIWMIDIIAPSFFFGTDAREFGKAYTSAGIEGFKGCKRGTNIAAQTSAMSFAKRLVRQSKVH